MQIKNDYLRDENGEIKYHDLCIDCIYKCKQSYKSHILNCPKKREQKNNK